jgi:hypothetical protein
MKHIDVHYADLAIVADLILKGGTVVEDKKKYIIGFAKDLNIPVTLQLNDTTPSCILVNVDFDEINERIISYYMKAGIYVNIARSPQGFMQRSIISINLYSIE